MKKLIALLMALSLLTAMLCGCASTAQPAEETEAPAQQSEAPADETPAEAPAQSDEPAPAEEAVPEQTGWDYQPLNYPLDNPDNVTFSYWVIMDLSGDSILSDLSEHPVVQKMKDYTGVGISLIVNSQYTGTEKTNLMYTSGEYPDFISNFSYTFGTESAIEDDIIFDMTDMLPEYAPDDPLWLTLDGVLNGDFLCGAFGVKLKVDSQASSTSGFYLENGEVKFGYLGDGLKGYLEVMNKWYTDGLISKKFTTHITEMRDEGMIESILTGKTGIFSRGDGLMDMFNKRGSGEGYKVVAIADAVQNEGDIIPFGNSQSMQAGMGMAITTQCEYPELGMQWANYWYTDEGYILGNYGLEGVRFEFDDNGDPQFTELMTNDPGGRPLSSMKIDYVGFIALRTDNSKPEASYSQAAQDAPVIWGSNRTGDGDLPSSATMTAEEGEEFSVIFSDITTYCSENLVRFIIGDRPLSEVENFQTQIKSMNIDRCLELWGQAIERYNNR